MIATGLGRYCTKTRVGRYLIFMDLSYQQPRRYVRQNDTWKANRGQLLLNCHRSARRGFSTQQVNVLITVTKTFKCVIRIEGLRGCIRFTDMRHLTTVIRSEKCVVGRFRRCANVIEYLHKPYSTVQPSTHLGCMVQPNASRLQTCTACYWTEYCRQL